MDPKNDKFENGNEYKVQVGVSGYDFSSFSKSDKSALKGYINDEEVDWIEYTDWRILLNYNFGVLGGKQETTQPEKEPEKPQETEKPKDSPATIFTDISKGQYYYDAVYGQ